MEQTLDGELFKARKRTSAVDSVLQTIRDLLLNKQLKRGDRLPNEMELTKMLATSRGTIREAMKILSSFGIVEIKRGDGTYIARSMSDRLFDHLVFQMILSDTDKKKLMELRELLEIGIIKIVIDNADDEGIRAIRREFTRMAERVEAHETDPSVLTDLDIAFHRAIGSATKNELIRKVYDITLDLFAPSIRQTHERADKGRNALEHHLRILEGIEARDRQRAEAAAAASIEQWVMLSS